MSKKAKQEAKQRASTRQLIGTKEITEYSLQTYGHGELVYFIIKPSNISVLSEASISTRIYALMTVLKGIAEIEILCLNSRENFENNKQFLRSRMEQEQNPVVRKLLEKDLSFLDRIQVQMATAREFLILIRLRNEKEKEVRLKVKTHKRRSRESANGEKWRPTSMPLSAILRPKHRIPSELRS